MFSCVFLCINHSAKRDWWHWEPSTDEGIKWWLASWVSPSPGLRALRRCFRWISWGELIVTAISHQFCEGSFCLAALWEMEKKTLLVPKCANLDGPSRTCIPQGLVSYQAESKKRNKAREVPSVLDILIKFLTLRNWAFELLPSRCSHALHQRGCRCQIRCSAWKPRRNVGRNCRTEPSLLLNCSSQDQSQTECFPSTCCSPCFLLQSTGRVASYGVLMDVS